VEEKTEDYEAVDQGLAEEEREWDIHRYQLVRVYSYLRPERYIARRRQQLPTKQPVVAVKQHTEPQGGKLIGCATSRDPPPFLRTYVYIATCSFPAIMYAEFTFAQ
jgi:hypothetical protein